MSFLFPLATTTWDEAEERAMRRVMAGGRYTMGPEVAAFEAAFAQHFGSRFAVMVNSGSSANLLMAAALTFTQNPALRLSRGDEVIVPAVSWPTTYYPLSQYGYRLKFVDIDLETLNYDLSALEAAVDDQTRAIMVVNLLGNPNEFKHIARLTAGRDIRLLEDNCEAMGARYAGRQAGTFGVMGSFSCFFSHHISTMEGGVVVTDDEELCHILLALRAHGWTRDLPKNNRLVGTKGDDPFEESFRFVLPGYNLWPLELSGAIGREQLQKLPALIEGRRANAARLTQVLGNHPDILLQREVGESSWFGFSLVIRPDSSMRRPRLVRRLTEAGFECRPIVAGNFARNEVMSLMDHKISGLLKNADHIHDNGLFIGNHHTPMDEAIEALALALDASKVG
jgi:CDP-6-deoxy-D-xylo-4-hexulose-3-dehydrase